TFLESAQLERLCSLVRREFECAGLPIEWTVEGNPEGLSAEKIQILKSHGVTRFSLGIQSFNDRHLKYLGRNHDAKTAAETFQRLRDEGIKNISVDLMFGFPGQTLDELKDDLEAMIQLESEHVSVYALTIEEKTRFHTRGIKLPEDAVQAEFYQVVMDELQRRGFAQYEISNFARPGFESAHNINYWDGGNYIGLGVGAHSHADGRRYWNGDQMFDYMKKIQNGQSAVSGEENLTSDQRLREAVVFGLRMNRGIDLEGLQKRYQSALMPQAQERLESFVAGGLLYREESRLSATPRGRMVLDEMAGYLV
ncbi:MAG: hypothetical protein COW13_01630, partial [Candidatus Omnitrophica bacterium CG12_big_fil_rev_8_21_14_0_65_50_5]